MKLLGIILLGLTFTFDGFAQTTSDEESISAAVTSFYVWYIGTIKNKRYSEYVKGVKGEKGNTKLETKEYFKRLDSLGVIGKKFIEFEKKRLRPCADFLKTIPWKEFSTPNGHPYEDKCGFFYNYYWTHGLYDRVEVLDKRVNKKSASVCVNIYFGDDKFNGGEYIVKLKKSHKKWMITGIWP